MLDRVPNQTNTDKGLTKAGTPRKVVQRAWTMPELRKAGKLWAEGLTIKQVAAEIGRTYESVKHQTESRRDIFPHRRHRMGPDYGRKRLTLPLSPTLYALVKKEAKARNTSMIRVIRTTLTAALLAKK